MHARDYHTAGRLLTRYNELKRILDHCLSQPGGRLQIKTYLMDDFVEFDISAGLTNAIKEQVDAAAKKLADIGVEVD